MTRQTRSTHSTRKEDVQKHWVVIDATDAIVGRLASFIAVRLRGKHKPSYTPHVDDGDNVIVVNVEKVAFTGKKLRQKTYYHYTGFQGGLKERSASFILNSRFPERVLEKAVERMLPRGPLGRRQRANLFVYKGAGHPHQAQKPRFLDFAAFNPKNVKGLVELSSYAPAIASNMTDVGGTVHALPHIWTLDILKTLDNAKISDSIKDMKTSNINGLFSKLILDLDNADPVVVTSALTQLSVMIPRLDLTKCLADPALRATLRRLPERLLTALVENLEASRSAKSAAFALVAAMYPAHYRKDLGAEERTVKSDLENIFERNHVHSFMTVQTRPSDEASDLDARIWTEMPFELAGSRPTLPKSKMLSNGGEFALEVAGAKLARLEVIKAEELAKGQFAGLRAKLMPDADAAISNKVVVHIKRDEAIYGREVFDFKTLFPHHPSAPTTKSAS